MNVLRDANRGFIRPVSVTQCPIGNHIAPAVCSASGCTICELSDRIRALEVMLKQAGYSQEQIEAATPYIETMGG